MVVSTQGIETFLARPIRSFAWVKQCDYLDLQADVDKLLPPAHFVTKPWLHQLACFIIGVNRHEFIYFVDMGGGKSKIGLDIIKYRQFADGLGKTLWVVPNLVNIRNFNKQVKIHQPSLRTVLLDGSSAMRWQMLEESDGDVWIINYQGLTALLSRQIGKGEQQGLGRGRRAKKRGWMIDEAAVKKFLALGWDCLMLDEIQNVKNPASLYFQLAVRIGDVCRFRYGFSGTPMNVDPSDFWGEFFCIDRGDTLGRTLTVFRQVYCTHKVNWFGVHEFKFKRRLIKDLNARLQNRSIRYEPDECSDLPERIETTLTFEVPSTTMRYYRSLMEEFERARKSGNRTLLKSSFMRLRQLSSGFCTVDGGDDGKNMIEFAENPKLDGLADLVRELPADRKMVVFTDFVWSTERIGKLLTQMKVEHLLLYGKTKNPGDVYEAFLDDERYRILVANAQSGGVGLDLFVANYVAIYECPVAPITRQQIEKRAWRPGQLHRVNQYDLVVRETKDEEVLASVRDGFNLMSRLLNEDRQSDMFRR